MYNNVKNVTLQTRRTQSGVLTRALYALHTASWVWSVATALDIKQGGPVIRQKAAREKEGEREEEWKIRTETEQQRDL